MNDFFTYVNKKLVFNEEYCNFSGNRSLSNRKIKNNHKYYVYHKVSEKPVILSNMNKLEIVEIVKEKNLEYIFYIDSYNKLSFIKVRRRRLLSERKLIDKIEKNPLSKTYLFFWLQSIMLFGVLRFTTYSFNSIEISLGYSKAVNANVRFLFPKFIREKFALKTNKFSLLVHVFWCKVPLAELTKKYYENSEINVPFFIKVINDDFHYYYNLKHSSKDRYNKIHYIYNTKSKKIKNTELELFVRKSITGQYVAVFTSVLELRVKTLSKLAYLTTRGHINKSIYNVYFEKFCEGASESAFELFKEAAKYDRKARYILSKENPQFNKLKEEYPDRILAQNSYKAFCVLFLAHSFISSDLVTHIQRRLYDNGSFIKKKILENKKKVFLQHGVCLATNVFERGYYNTKVPIAPDYIIVNSEFEKNQFKTYTNYKDEHLIKTGLPNLDLYVKQKDVIKSEITFMLTWRPWDLTDKIETGSYLDRYRMFMKLVSEKAFYNDKKVNIILHPKSKIILREQFPGFYSEIKSKIFDGDIKDALLRTKVLISDYSSVTFYAFAGGSNVVFYWEDKYIAEKEYGAPNILQEDIAFGEIVYHFKELQKSIERNYLRSQKTEFIEMYKVLVEHQDGNNTSKAFKYIFEDILYPDTKNQYRIG